MPKFAIPPSEAFVLRNCSVPETFLASHDSAADGGPDAAQEGAPVICDIHVSAGQIVAVVPAGTVNAGAAPGRGHDGPEVDLARAMVWPCFADIHCHLDKGQIFDRTLRGDGSFFAALDAVGTDRINWTAADTRFRMDFGLRCAFAHGTAAVRTHIDSDHATAMASWEAFAELRDGWADRIDLQAVSLVQAGALADFALARDVADRVALFGGILGASTRQVPDLDAIIDNVFRLAEERYLALDFHVDESADPAAAALSLIAETAIRRKFAGTIVVGHCCSLAMQDAAQVDRTLDLVAEAGLAVTTLPALNLQLQDRSTGRTPRWRGVTLVHEMRARGIPVAIGGDNVRDPLHPYGDHDMLEAYRDATRIGHLDAPFGAWPASVTTLPRALMGLPERRIAPGHPADLVIFAGRTYSELLARPQSDRIVLRGGVPSTACPPDFSELDGLRPDPGAC